MEPATNVVRMTPREKEEASHKMRPQHQTGRHGKSPDKQREKWSGWKFALVLLISVLAFLTARTLAPEPETVTVLEPIQDPLLVQRVGEVEAELNNIGAELIAVRSEKELLEQQLSDSVPAEELNQVQATLDALIIEEGILAEKLKTQVDIAAELQTDLDVANAITAQAQTKAQQAVAESTAQSIRATTAETALATELGQVPDRLLGAFELMAPFELVEEDYFLGEVVFELQRPGIWDDETQFFWGSGSIALLSGLHEAKVEWQGETLWVELPLPRVQPWQAAQIEGKTDAEREQFARIGGRWGDQTEWFVDDEAKKETAQRACSDVNLLRKGVNTLLSITREMSLGFDLKVIWFDDAGNSYDTVSDEVLLNNAC